MPKRDHLRQLAARLAMDRSIDWDAEERAAADENQRAAIRQLRLIAAMGGFYRAVPPSAENEDMSASISLARSVTGYNDESDGASEPRLVPSSSAARESALHPGSRWGHLEVMERVGGGAFGEVFRARDTRLDRVVALKLIARDGSGATDERVREARLMAKARHPNVVLVHGADRIDGRVGIWMEFLEGETLDRVLRARGTLGARETALIGIDLCRALSAVHATGTIHQDVKLSNVMRAEGGRIVLMDFGLGRETAAADGTGSQRSLSGTPMFMAPEVLRGAEPSARSDVYSLGVVLFSLITGSFPVEAGSLAELRARHERGSVKHARELRPDLPEDFAHVLDRILSPDPQNRFATPAEVERSLLRSLGAAVEAGRTETPAAPRKHARTALLVAASLVVIALALGWQQITARRASPAAFSAPFADNPTLTLIGEHAEDMFGFAVAAVGDVDQDGFDDLLVGAPFSDEGVRDGGKAYLYRGGKDGLEPNPSWTVVGTADGATMGAAIAPRTNLSFDGFADIVIGDRRRVLVYPGSANGPASVPAQILTGGDSTSLFGCALATGDVDHDGDDDLLVGEPLFRTPASESGRALLYLTQNGVVTKEPVWTSLGPEASQFGIFADMSGDVNNDGFRDAVVGAKFASFGPERRGSGGAFVYLGSSAGLDSIPVVLPGKQAGSGAGEVAIAGDLDGDGYDDLLVGAEWASNGDEREGVVEIYFGSRSGILPYGASFVESNNAGANFGSNLGALGDLDGDGCGEFYAGAIRYQVTAPREGAASIFRGSPRRDFQRIWFRCGGKAGSWYGARGGSAGDLNGDGLTDFFVAAHAWDSDAGENVGRVDIFLQRPKR
ncbi:MAG: protein kinase domain-containing protein [bacterium]